MKLAWQLGFQCSGTNIFIDTGSINEKHCSAPRELLSIMSRHDIGKAPASSQRSKKEDKTLLHPCLPLVSFPFPLGTGPALWDSSGNGSGARGVQLLNPSLRYKQHLMQRKGTNVKTIAKRINSSGNQNKPRSSATSHPGQVSSLVSHTKMPSKGAATTYQFSIVLHSHSNTQLNIHKSPIQALHKSQALTKYKMTHPGMCHGEQ